MKRLFEFDGDSEQDKTRFKIIVTAAQVGTMVENQHGRPAGNMETLRSRGRLKRAFASVAGEDAESDAKANYVSRNLKPGAQSFSLQQQDVDTLKDFFPKVPWSLMESEDAAEAFDWVSSRPEAPKE